MWTIACLKTTPFYTLNMLERVAILNKKTIGQSERTSTNKTGAIRILYLKMFSKKKASQFTTAKLQ